MITEEVQRRSGRLVAFAVFLVTVFVTPFTTLDPINLPKFWMLLAFSLALLAVILTKAKVLFNRSNWMVLGAAGVLVIFMLIAALVSDAPMPQQIFGTNGRNTGLLTYLSFAILFVGTALATSFQMAKTFMYATCGALGVNVVYGLVQAMGNDPIKWSNLYSPVIGTLGNPNFVAAFLGMGVGFVLPFAIAKDTKLKFRVLATLYIIVAIYDMLKSDAQQGIIVSLISVGLVGFFWIRSKFSGAIYKYGYLALGLVGGIFAILGTLQKGPLASIIYKPSVTYRGDYWHAGIEMFKANPIFGVGLDSYGDWYRAERTVEATLRRGPSVTANAAHNVFIDIAATAGIFSLLAYIAIIALGFRAMWRIMKRGNNFDPFVIAIFTAWMGYLVQSVISINNIALGIWGFVLPGLLIAADRWIDQAEKKELGKKITGGMNDFSSMALAAGLVLGGVIGFMPFNADASFRHGIEAGNKDLIKSAATKWPKDAYRLMYAASIFNQNKLQNEAVVLARDTVSLNPRWFDGWNFLYNAPETTSNEKREILDRLKALDPHNPDLAKLGK